MLKQKLAFAIIRYIQLDITICIIDITFIIYQFVRENQMKVSNKLVLALTGALLAISAQAHASGDYLSDFLQSDAPFKKEFDLGGHITSVQFYGIVDIGYGYTDHSLPQNRDLPASFYPFLKQRAYYSSSQSDWFAGGLSSSRAGIKADASLFNLGDTNVKALLNLESGFDPLNFKLYSGAKTLVENSGSTTALKSISISNESSLNGQFFNRAANAGLSFGEYGAVTFGLQNNTFKDILSAYDPVNSDNFSALGQSGTIGGSGGVSENVRLQNSLKYTNAIAVPSIPLEGAKVNTTAIYQWGNAVNLNYGYGYALQAGLESKVLGIQAGYNRFEDAVSATNSNTAGAITGSSYNTHAWLVSARFNPVPALKISGGWEQFTRSRSTDDLSHAYGDLWGYTLAPGIAQGLATPGETQQYNVYFLGAGYDFGDSFPQLAGLKIQAGYYDYITGKAYNATGSVNTNSPQGRIGTWSTVVDYKINKRFDIYAAATESHFSGGAYLTTGTPTATNSVLNPEQLFVGTGLRFKF